MGKLVIRLTSIQSDSKQTKSDIYSTENHKTDFIKIDFDSLYIVLIFYFLTEHIE